MLKKIFQALKLVVLLLISLHLQASTKNLKLTSKHYLVENKYSLLISYPVKASRRITFLFKGVPEANDCLLNGMLQPGLSMKVSIFEISCLIDGHNVKKNIDAETFLDLKKKNLNTYYIRHGRIFNVHFKKDVNFSYAGIRG